MTLAVVFASDKSHAASCSRVAHAVFATPPEVVWEVGMGVEKCLNVHTYWLHGSLSQIKIIAVGHG